MTLHISHSAAETCLNQPDALEVLNVFNLETYDSENSKNKFNNVWKKLEKKEFCNESELSYQVIKAIIDLKNLPTLSTQLDDFDQGVLNDSPYNFFKERARTIRLNLNPESSKCESEISGAMAYVTDSFSNTMYVCPFSMRFSQLKLKGMLIHEARHLFQDESFGKEKQAFLERNDGKKGPSHSHVSCKIGFFAHSFSCDRSVESKGSYGVEMEFYLKLYRSQKVAEKTRQQARALLIDGYLGHFNSLPDGQIGLVLRSENGDMIFHNTKTKTNNILMTGLQPEEVVTDRFSLSVFNSLDGTALNYTLSNSFHDTPGTLAKYFREELTREKQLKLRDVVYGLKIQCMLFSDSFTCYKKNNYYTINIPIHLNATQFTTLKSIPDRDFIFITTDQGEHYRVPFEKGIENIKFYDLEKTPSLFPFRSAALMPGLKRYAIDQQGVFVSYESNKHLNPIEELSDKRFTQLFGPYMWSEKLLEL